MFQFSSLLGPKIPPSSAAFISQVEETIKANASYIQTVQKWRNLQISYMSKMAELQAEVADRHSIQMTKSDSLLFRVIEILLNNHKNLINKLNHDIFLNNFQECQKMIIEQKGLLEQQKYLHKELTVKKQAMERVQARKHKLRKNMEQEMILQIFSQDSCDATMGKKLKRFNKLKEINKQQEQFELKVKETKQILYTMITRSKENLGKFRGINQKIHINRIDMSMKMQLHVTTFAKNLASDLEDINTGSTNYSPPEMNLTNKFIESEEEYIEEIKKDNQGYLEVTLKLINDKSIDEVIEYSKDREIKKKIKRIIESTNVNPEDTDELTRQVQLVKKIMKNKDSSSIIQFKNIIVKSCKFRMNFVFILQMYRLNSKFEIDQEELKPMILLINELLTTCHEHRDALVLKQLMVLMLTYYVLHKENEEENKIYIMSFFKESKLWKDIELWESILIQCIYLEKKSTIRMFLVTSAANSNRNELVEAEKTAVLNQILYIVRNMILFDYTEKEVKEFTNKFVKMLKQDDRFLKDVHKSIESAVKEENDNMPPPATFQFIRNWSGCEESETGNQEAF